MLTVNAERTGDVAVVQCSGRLVRGESVSALRNAVVSQKDVRVVVLDLCSLEFVDANGLGTLVSLEQWTRARGIQLKLVNSSAFVCDLLKRTGLDHVLETSTLADSLWVLSGADRECRRGARRLAGSVGTQHAVVHAM